MLANGLVSMRQNKFPVYIGEIVKLTGRAQDDVQAAKEWVIAFSNMTVSIIVIHLFLSLVLLQLCPTLLELMLVDGKRKYWKVVTLAAEENQISDTVTLNCWM